MAVPCRCILRSRSAVSSIGSNCCSSSKKPLEDCSCADEFHPLTRPSPCEVHGIDASEKVVVRKQLRRSQILAFFKALPSCLIGMEACATAHYWARELTQRGRPGR